MAVLQLIAKQAQDTGKPVRTAKYYGVIADSGGFSVQLAAVRVQRLAADDKSKADAQLAAKNEVIRLRETEPDCEHGTAAGRSPHPTTGLLLCPQCRAGQPAPSQQQTSAADQAQPVIDAYRAGWSGAGHEPIEMTTLMAISAETAAMLAAGRSPRLLIELARIAGAGRNTLTNTEQKLAEAIR